MGWGFKPHLAHLWLQCSLPLSVCEWLNDYLESSGPEVALHKYGPFTMCCSVSSTEWSSWFYRGQKCQCFARFSFRVRSEGGCSFWATSAGRGERTGHLELRYWWWIHISFARSLHLPKTSGPIQHQRGWQHLHPFQKCVPDDHNFLFQGKVHAEPNKIKE